jgi:L-alanine-DL-glutamate epimerase-like enolase superfamily enzyme
VHASAAMPNFLILEHCRLRPWFDDVQAFGPKVENGRVALSDRPGLGIELDWEYVEKHPYAFKPLRTFRDQDGGLPMV